MTDAVKKKYVATAYPKAVTIAGSDSGGGAGIQADLKTMTALGVYGCSVITALTAQNTVGVQGVETIDPFFVREQIDSTLGDIQPDAGKTGMLATAEIVEVVADGAARHGLEKLVVDPVMVSKHGHRLLDPSAEAAVRDRLLPRALLVTPNLPEAEVLTGMEKVQDLESMREAARRLRDLGARNVLVKGGHLKGKELVDLLFDGDTFTEFQSARFDTPHTHGTGCTLSAAIAAHLAKGLSVADAVAAGRYYLQMAIRTARTLGAGIGPVNHLWPIELGD